MNTFDLKKQYQAGIAPVIILAIVLAVAVIGGGAAYYFMGSSGSSTMESSPDGESAPSSAGAKMDEDSPEALESGTEVAQSFEQIFAFNRSLECTWRPPAQAEGESMEGFVEGKLYTSGGKGRSMATMTINGMPSEANAIYDGGTVTSWVSLGGQEFGFIMTPEEMQNESTELTEEERRQAEQYRSEMIVSCKPWTADESFFTPPSDVNFDTLSPLMDAPENANPESMEGFEMPTEEQLKMMREMQNR